MEQVFRFRSIHFIYVTHILYVYFYVCVSITTAQVVQIPFRGSVYRVEVSSTILRHNGTL